MCRTTLNVTGDLTAAVVISRGEPHEGERADQIPGAPPQPV
jgi:Na+/H+-dicarboxylate symporter